MTLPTAVLTITELIHRLRVAEGRIDQLTDENAAIRRDLSQVVAGVAYRI